MTLRQKQSQFVRAVADLIIFAYGGGYELTFGDALAKTGHCKGSFHYKGLAIDFNLFRNGKYLKDTEAYRELGEYWKSQGGSWGGDWEDGCHFSWGESSR